jgi:hypothetical protein
MPGTQLQVASQHAGVNLNILSDDQFVDKLTGTAAFNGTPVSVSKVKKSSQNAKQKPNIQVNSELV